MKRIAEAIREDQVRKIRRVRMKSANKKVRNMNPEEGIMSMNLTPYNVAASPLQLAQHITQGYNYFASTRTEKGKPKIILLKESIQTLSIQSVAQKRISQASNDVVQEPSLALQETRIIERASTITGMQKKLVCCNEFGIWFVIFFLFLDSLNVKIKKKLLMVTSRTPLQILM